MTRERYTARPPDQYVAVVYQFVFEPMGWATFTVCDATGEFSVQSDWGNYSYRWSPDPKSLGAPTLTEFFRKCSGPDYITSKLTVEHRNEMQVLRPKESIRGVREEIIKERRLAVREPYRTWRSNTIDRKKARLLWEQVKEWIEDMDPKGVLCYEHLPEELGEFLGEHPFDYLVFEDKRPTDILKNLLIPTFLAHLRGEPAQGHWADPAYRARYYGLTP